MPIPVPLSELVDALETVPGSGEGRAYLNRKTGEAFVASLEEIRRVEEDEPLDDLADWEREAALELREAWNDLLPLPDKFDLHEAALLRRFALEEAPERARDALLGALGGRGTCGRFKREAARFDLLDAWHAFRRREPEAVARRWAEENGVPVV